MVAKKMIQYLLLALVILSRPKEKKGWKKLDTNIKIIYEGVRSSKKDAC